MAHKALTALRHGWPGWAISRCGVRLLDARKLALQVRCPRVFGVRLFGQVGGQSGLFETRTW